MGDPANTAVAILSFGIELAPPDAKGHSRQKLLPYGTLRNKDGRGSWVLADSAQAETVIAATRLCQGGQALALDFDSQTVLGRGVSRAWAGWIEPASLSAEVDAIYGIVNWTFPGADAIKDKSYRYVSAHVLADKASGRIVRLVSAGVTNSPTSDFPTLTAQASSTMKITAEERAVASAMGLTDAQFLDAKAREAAASRVSSLSADELAVASAFGLIEAEFLSARAAQVPTAHHSLLTKEELAIASAFGLSEAEFLAAKQRRAG